MEVNYPQLTPQGSLAIFALLGLVLAFLAPYLKATPAGRSRLRTLLDLLLALGTGLVFGYVIVQSEPVFSDLWLTGRSLGDRAGLEAGLDLAMGAVGLLLVLEAARRTLGKALPLLAIAFLVYAWVGPHLPDLLLPHRGYDPGRIVSQTFLHSQGVFGVALSVMFTYVFLFVVFGALLEVTGATGYAIGAARRLFLGSPGGPAKVAVAASGLMGSLSGSAVANTATTGTFTIPMMRSAGFPRHTAAGLEAAASSGGALVPPVMGAGAYMMLELVTPPVTYLEIVRAALLPALLYYGSLFLIVHLQAQRLRAAAGRAAPPGPASKETSSAKDHAESETSGNDTSESDASLLRWEGLVFLLALGGLVGFLAVGFSVFRAVTLAGALVLVVAAFHRRTRPGRRALAEALVGASKAGVPLVAATASVGIIIGVVTLTGVGTRLPALIVPLADGNLLAALGLIMVSSIVLGMGLPSAVCYLLMATLVGPVLGNLGVVPLGAHLFIFYFGMMSMVTPPVALAAYAASSIADSDLFQSSWAAFRFALVGFTLPYLFIFRPELLMLTDAGTPATPWAIALAVLLAAAGIFPLAAAIAGHLRRPLGRGARTLLFLSAALALLPATGPILRSAHLSVANLLGIAIWVGVWWWQGRVESPLSSTS